MLTHCKNSALFIPLRPGLASCRLASLKALTCHSEQQTVTPYYLQASSQLKIFPAKLLEKAAAHRALFPCSHRTTFNQPQHNINNND